VGRFVRYDSESKGYRIYWPGKRSVSVERNVVFNENDVRTGDESVTVLRGVQSEGEMESEKVIQHSTNSIENPKDSDEAPEKEPIDDTQEPDSSNTIPFPTVPNETDQVEDESSENDEPEKLGRGQRARPAKGAYKQMNKTGLVAAVTHFVDLDDENKPPEPDFNSFPNEFALVSTHPSDPKTLDEALRRPDAKLWEEAL
jgi:hypothetical protein